ncbi:MAG: hypothetical protein DYG93_07655 [Leptolyngbya sp. PLA2]|nr:hypothetical protein [Leptolyngbya sp.]MCE7971522.1 hypothetical protein [Leptolyngbya sp. PL-A2]MCQ3940736.1 hypothetical protein [cyanobacterium CYA1]MDL1903706.1 hypothetical protein [Synechococcales cyanobacterium CNB]
MNDSQFAPTVGVIARRFGQPVHRVEYVIRSRGIKPVAWAGHARVFSETDVHRIGRELERMRHALGRGVD